MKSHSQKPTRPMDSPERRLNQALEALRQTPLSAEQREDSAARVWQKLAAAGQDGSVGAPRSGQPCAPFQEVFHGYVAHTLDADGQTLMRAHLATCLDCRRALKATTVSRDLSAQHAGVTSAGAGGLHTSLPRTSRQTSSLPVLLLAAALVLLTAGAALLLPRVLQTSISGPVATVATIRGTLVGQAGTGLKPLQAGQTLTANTPVRTTSGSHAVVTLNDGSRIELDERTALSITGTSAGMTLHLDRGRIVVEAAPQGSGHLFVQTQDALTSVVGTIFSVYSGLKGTRVAVVEGEVHVTENGVEHILHPGDQVTSSSSLGWIALEDTLSWSQKLEAYRGMLEARAGSSSSAAQAPEHGVSSRFVDLQPAGTAFYLGMPLWGSVLGDHEVQLMEALSGSPLLARWWESAMAASAVEEQVLSLLDWTVTLQETLGDEASLSFQLDDQGNPEGVLLMADVADEAGLRSLLSEASLEGIFSDLSGLALDFRLVEDPMTLSDDAPHGLYFYQGEGLLVLSSSPSSLRETGGALVAGAATTFETTGFAARLRLGLDAGTSWLLGADLGLVMAGAAVRAPEEAPLLAELGLLDVDYFLADARTLGAQTTAGAALTFDQNRRGLAALLAEPAPMGALRLVSPSASLVAAMLVRSPAEALNELFVILERHKPGFQAALQDFEAREGFQVIRDLAAPLGRELLLAVDGPLVPALSWKLVLEVEEQAQLMNTLALLLEKIHTDDESAPCATLTLSQSQYAGTTAFELGGSGACLQVAFAFVEGYLVVVPSLGLLQRTLDDVRNGLSLSASPALASRLPLDGFSDLSGVIYQNLGALLVSMPAELVATTDLPDDMDWQTLLQTAQTPSVLAVYAEPSQVLLATTEDAAVASSRVSALVQLVGLLGQLEAELP